MTALNKAKQIMRQLAEEHGSMMAASRHFGKPEDYFRQLLRRTRYFMPDVVCDLAEMDPRFAAIADDLNREAAETAAIRARIAGVQRWRAEKRREFMSDSSARVCEIVRNIPHPQPRKWQTAK